MAKDLILEEDLLIISKEILQMNEIKESTILITGATGLIGSQIVKALLYSNKKNDSKIKVLAVIRNEEKAKKVFQGYLDNKNLTFINWDIVKPITIDYKVDYIIHAASETVSKRFVTYPVETIHTSIDGSKNLLELAKAKNVKGFVYLSSMEAFGITDPSLDSVREEDLGYIDIHNVRSCYSESKRMVECMCSCYSYQYNIPIKIARLAQTFGAGVSKYESRIFAQFAKSVINGTDIILHTTGESYGNYVYTRDAILAILKLLIKGENGKAYTICNESTNIKIKDMAQMIVDKFSNGRIKIVFDIPDNNLTYGYAPDVNIKLNSDKMKSLGWIPSVNLEESYRRMIESMKMQE